MTWLLNRPPLNVQREAIKQANAKRRRGSGDSFLYWEEMGLGKTSTVLNEFLVERKNRKVDFLIVVTLQSFKMGWVTEADVVGADLKIGMWPDCRKVPHTKLHGVVINYEALRGAGGEHIEKILLARKCYMAFDECHKIKNPSSDATKRAIHLWKHAVIRRGLTGTPMSNNVMDLYPQLRLGGGLDGVNPYMFRNYYAQMGGFKGKQVIGIREDRKDELTKLMDKHSFRALKSDWLDLPEQTWVNPLRVDMPPPLAAAYKKMRTEFVLALDDGTLITAEMVIGQMLKLQQISSGFIYDGDRTDHTLMKADDIPKYQAVFDLIDSLGGGSKLLIFVYFRPTLRTMVDYLQRKLKYLPAFITGGMTAGETQKQKDIFNADSGIDTMVAQISVGSATHTLLGAPSKPCHTTLFFENSYNLIDRKQAESRNHRTGQKYAVSYYDIISSPIEFKPIRALQAKSDMVKAIIDGVRENAE